MALLNFNFRETPQEKEQRALEEARKQYALLLGQSPQTALAPQEGPVRPGETLPPITQTTEGSGLLGGQVPLQEFLLKTAGMPGNIGPNALAIAKQGGVVNPFGKIDPKDYTQESLRQFQATRDYSTLQAAGSPAKQAETLFKNAKALRGEFTQATKNFADINNSYGRIKVSAENPSPAGDLSLIFNYMKMLDPESVVRESEFATAAATGSYGERIKAFVQKALSGERLSDDQRLDFVNRAKELYKEAATIHSGRVKEFEKKATQFNVDPSTVIFNRQFHNPVVEKPKQKRTPKRTGIYNGRKVIEYTDGTIDYAD